VVSGGVVSGGVVSAWCPAAWSQTAWCQTLHSLARPTGFRDPPELVTGADPLDWVLKANASGNLE
jgi:hypothetical protein